MTRTLHAVDSDIIRLGFQNKGPSAYWSPEARQKLYELASERRRAQFPHVNS